MAIVDAFASSEATRFLKLPMKMFVTPLSNGASKVSKFISEVPDFEVLVDNSSSDFASSPSKINLLLLGALQKQKTPLDEHSSSTV